MACFFAKQFIACFQLLCVYQILKISCYLAKEQNCPLCDNCFVSTAPVSPLYPVPACWGESHDSGSHLPHSASPLLPWTVSQHHGLGPAGATQHPQTLELELPAACTPTTALCCTVLQRGEAPCLYVIWTSWYVFIYLNVEFQFYNIFSCTGP